MVDPERGDDFRERRDVRCEQRRSEHGQYGTPYSQTILDDYFCPTRTDCERHTRYELTQLSVGPDRPQVNRSRRSRSAVSTPGGGDTYRSCQWRSHGFDPGGMWAGGAIFILDSGAAFRLVRTALHY